LLVLAVLNPVLSQPAANIAVAPTNLSIDWIVLFVHPMMYLTSPQFVWLVLTGSLLLLALLPFMSRKPRAQIATVEPDFCNGCRRCFDDCPYAAVTMVPHPNGRTGKELALVNADLCAGCGICVGACPSSTPFRSAAELVTGIDLPQSPIGDLRKQLQAGLAGLKTPQKWVVFGCDHGADVKALRDGDVVSYSMVCTGMLPPSFVEYALRDGADGVLVTGCRPGGCEFRLGQQWTEERLMGQREPYLRASVPQARVEIAWADVGGELSLATALDKLRQRVAQLDKSTEVA
jgi:coenzyme F420-reducing hydrogenase delta subunit/Pyruvate/2-oxoacid:ferredoxin oxidoreductase delta subunit